MISSIVLAAGMSTRMGEPKALLDWGGEPLVAFHVKQLKEAGVDEVIVVLGFRSDDIHRQMKGLPCRVMLNPRFHAGRAGSLRIGAKAASRDAEAIVIINVDEPRPASFLRDLVAAHDMSRAATRPTAEGHRGHPVIVSGALREELMGASDDSGGLHGVLAAHESEIVDVPADPVCHLDFNTPDELFAARQRFGLAS